MKTKCSYNLKKMNDMTDTTHTPKRGYASISTTDGRFRLWIPRPTVAGTMCCTCGFGLRSHLPFVDAIDKLDYVHVEALKQLDEDFSIIILQLDGDRQGTLARLMEDIPKLMEEHL